NKRNRESEAENIARLAAIDSRVSIIDKELAVKFPDYATLVNPQPLSVEGVRAQLAPNEALVLFLDTRKTNATPEETFIWVVTKTGMRWVRSRLGTPAMTREVAALRCGLDANAWNGDGWQTCHNYTNADPVLNRDGDIVVASLPFDSKRAHALYKALFGQ